MHQCGIQVFKVLIDPSIIKSQRELGDEMDKEEN